MAIPACLWRRTGEIYKANREFAELVGVDNHMLREVRALLCDSSLIADSSSFILLGTPVYLRVDGRRLGRELLGGTFIAVSVSPIMY